jgi:UDP-N-acetylmuramate dehydrogenase
LTDVIVLAEPEVGRVASNHPLMQRRSRPGSEMIAEKLIRELRSRFGDRVRTNVPLAPLTSARIGGPADILVDATSSEILADVASLLWRAGQSWMILGGGSNVLVGDKGIRGVTILNRAKAVRFHEAPPGSVWAESGVAFSNLANRCAARGFSGLEWAATVPGTIGGAVYGNAGAFGSDTAQCLSWADVVTPSGRERWSPDSLGYGYRTSVLKRHEVQAVVLAAELKLQAATEEAVRARMAEFGERRKSTQPPGASMGSMFKNPLRDKAGRLIEAAGLKGKRLGSVEVSSVHANFFVNHGRATAADVQALILLVQGDVRAKFGVELELEIELVGE